MRSPQTNLFGRGKKAFIATQAPLDSTIENFYQMCIENNTSLIVMLCPCKEDTKVMSAEYFPSEAKPDDRHYQGLKIHLLKEQQPFPDLFVRDLEVTDESSGKTYNIRHV